MRQKMMGPGDGVTSARTYANTYHLASDRQQRQHLITQFICTGWFCWRQTNSVKAQKEMAWPQSISNKTGYSLQKQKLKATAIQEQEQYTSSRSINNAKTLVVTERTLESVPMTVLHSSHVWANIDS